MANNIRLKIVSGYTIKNVKGQILQEGINELGAGASWLAAATSYSTNNRNDPFYIYYSMFGFNVLATYVWAADDKLIVS